MDNTGIYGLFISYTVKDLEKMLVEAGTREEKAFFRVLINLKLQIDQEKIVGKALL